MLGRLRRRMSFANVTALFCLFVVLGGTSVAGELASDVTATAKRLITGKDIKNRSIKAKDIKRGTLTGAQVRDGSLGPADFSGSVAGPQGPQGDPGPSGSITGAPAGGALTGSYPDPQLAAPEPVQPLALATGAKAGLSGPHGDPRVFRDRSGMVHLAGLISRISGIGAGATWASLPEGYRPEFDHVFNTYTNEPGRLLVIRPDGTVTSHTSADPADLLGLFDAHFRCAPSGVAGCP